MKSHGQEVDLLSRFLYAICAHLTSQCGTTSHLNSVANIYLYMLFHCESLTLERRDKKIDNLFLISSHLVIP
jgi:hypothetical protein